MTESSSKAVLLPIDMGNYGRNSLQPKEIFERLSSHSREVLFLAYHWRRSGNFVFVDCGKETRKRALEAGETVTRLKCLIRTFGDLRKVDQAVPPEAQIRHGSMILPTGEKLIHVALSKAIIETARATGRIGGLVEILAWPSHKTPYAHMTDLKKKGGDVGQVTNNVLEILLNHSPDIYGTGRALSVIRDLLENRNMRYA